MLRKCLLVAFHLHTQEPAAHNLSKHCVLDALNPDVPVGAGAKYYYCVKEKVIAIRAGDADDSSHRTGTVELVSEGRSQ
jgi:hypothetical protein